MGTLYSDLNKTKARQAEATKRNMEELNENMQLGNALFGDNGYKPVVPSKDGLGGRVQYSQVDKDSYAFDELRNPMDPRTEKVVEPFERYKDVSYIDKLRKMFGGL